MCPLGNWFSVEDFRNPAGGGRGVLQSFQAEGGFHGVGTFHGLLPGFGVELVALALEIHGVRLLPAGTEDPGGTF
jgi:hypothetical protein